MVFLMDLYIFAKPIYTSSNIVGSKNLKGGAETRRLDQGHDVEFVDECALPTAHGHFRLRAYRWKRPDGTVLEPVVMIPRNWTRCGPEAPLVRVHDQCMTSEVLGSQRCDCKEQLDLALRIVDERGGAVIYIQQEGRGIGLANKVAAYHLQDGGLDTVDANRRLGFADDMRSYECIAFILNDLEFDAIRLLTNNPLKAKLLTASGVSIEAIVPLLISPTQYNRRYLRTKARRMAHALPTHMITRGSDEPDV